MNCTQLTPPISPSRKQVKRRRERKEGDIWRKRQGALSKQTCKKYDNKTRVVFQSVSGPSSPILINCRRKFTCRCRTIVKISIPSLKAFPESKHLNSLPKKKVREGSQIFKTHCCPRSELLLVVLGDSSLDSVPLSVNLFLDYACSFSRKSTARRSCLKLKFRSFFFWANFIR